MSYLTSQEFKYQAKAGDLSSSAVVRKQYVAAVEPLNDRQLRFVISSDAIDRDYDKIIQDGWQLSNYLKNPVVLWGHDADALPIGKCVEIGIQNGKLVATVEFAKGEWNPLAESVYQMCLHGFLSATSVGCKVLEWEFSDDPEREQRDGADFLKCDLLEFSVVNCPSNPEALIIVDGGNLSDQTEAVEEIEEAAPEEADSDKLLNTNASSRLRLLMKARISGLD